MIIIIMNMIAYLTYTVTIIVITTNNNNDNIDNKSKLYRDGCKLHL